MKHERLDEAFEHTPVAAVAPPLMFVLAVLAFVVVVSTLAGCSAMDNKEFYHYCNLAPTYSTVRAPAEGKITLRWSYGTGMPLGCHPSWVGCTHCDDTESGRVCNIYVRDGEPPKFQDFCGLALLGHEVAHSMGEDHPKWGR